MAELDETTINQLISSRHGSHCCMLYHFHPLKGSRRLEDRRVD